MSTSGHSFRASPEVFALQALSSSLHAGPAQAGGFSVSRRWIQTAWLCVMTQQPWNRVPMVSGSGVSKSQVQTVAKPGGQNTSMAHFWDVTTLASLPNMLPPARKDHGLVSVPLLSWITSVLVGLSQSVVVFKPSFSRHSCHLLSPPVPWTCSSPEARGHREGRGQQLPWHTKSTLRNAAYESADCS